MTFLLETLITATIFIVLAVSFDLIIGAAGLFSVAHAAFFGLGAYTVAILTERAGVPVLAAWLVSPIICGILSLLLAAIAVRVTSDYLVIASFGFLAIVTTALNNAGSFTGGFVGIGNIPPLGIFNITTSSNGAFLITYAIIAAAVVVFVFRLYRSPFGSALKAMRDNEVGVAALGKSPTLLKVWAFSIGGGLAGIAGAMYASYITYITPDAFGNDVTIQIFVMVFVGGAGTIIGPLLAAVLLTLVPAGVTLLPFPPSDLGSIEQVIYGGILLTIVMLLPEGLFGLAQRIPKIRWRPQSPVEQPSSRAERVG